MTRQLVIGLAITLCVSVVAYAKATSGDTVSATEAVKVTAKPLSENVERGLAWVIEAQHTNGGWTQGEESRQMGNSQANLKDKPDVADTCIALMALLRAGSTPKEGPHAESIRKGLGFVCAEIEAAVISGMFLALPG